MTTLGVQMGSWFDYFLAVIGARPELAATTARVTVRNDTTRPLQLIFEPWGTTYTISPGIEYVVEATSRRPGWLAVEPHVDDITVYAWDGCEARVFTADGKLIQSLDIPVPDFIALDEQKQWRDREAR
jgi:hypothetical protein